MPDAIHVVANNRAAYHEYFVLDTVEAGVALVGTEVKSIRAGKVNIRDGFVRIDYTRDAPEAAAPRGKRRHLQGAEARRPRLEAFLENVTIQPWETGNRYNHLPTRTRKLLLHRGEIAELFGKAREQGLTIVPLRLYFKEGKVKVEVALVKGKKSWDKRQAIAERDAKREMARALRRGER